MSGPIDGLFIAKKAISEAMTAVHGVAYTYGQSREILYPSSGTSKDWVLDDFKVPLRKVLKLNCSLAPCLSSCSLALIWSPLWKPFKVGHGSCATLVIMALFCHQNKLFQTMKKSWLDLEPSSSLLMKIIRKFGKSWIKAHLLNIFVRFGRFLT